MVQRGRRTAHRNEQKDGGFKTGRGTHGGWKSTHWPLSTSLLRTPCVHFLVASSSSSERGFPRLSSDAGCPRIMGAAPVPAGRLALKSPGSKQWGDGRGGQVGGGWRGSQLDIWWPEKMVFELRQRGQPCKGGGKSVLGWLMRRDALSPPPPQPPSSHPSSNMLGQASMALGEAWAKSAEGLGGLPPCDRSLGSFLSVGDLGERSRGPKRGGATSLFSNQRSGEGRASWNIMSFQLSDVASFIHPLPPHCGPRAPRRPLQPHLLPFSLHPLHSSHSDLLAVLPKYRAHFCLRTFALQSPLPGMFFPHPVMLSLIKPQLPGSGWGWAKEGSFCPKGHNP